MSRKCFLNYFKELFGDELNSSLCCFEIKEGLAEKIYDLLKKDKSSLLINRIILNIKEIKDIMLSLNENYSEDDLNDLDIDLDIDHYKMEDGILCYNVSFNPNLLYDLLQKTKGNKRKIYRVEDNEFKGAYSGILVNNKNIKNHQLEPSSDGDIKLIFAKDNSNLKIDYSNKWFFAFDNLEDLYNWFGDEIIDLNKFISIYKISDSFIIKGKKQIIFKKSESVFLHRL